MMGSSDFKKWEFRLLVLALLLFVITAILYFAGFSFRKYIFGWEDADEAAKTAIGSLTRKKSEVLRQFNNENEFKAIEHQAALYNFDTLVTAADGSATVTLDGGSTIELGPSTMVRLVFESRLSFTGVSRAANVEVVTGNVTGQALATKIVLKSKDKVAVITRDKQESVQVASAWPFPFPSPKPSPSPSPSPSPTPPPVSIELVAPKNLARISLDPGSQRPEKSLTLEWRISPMNLNMRMSLTRLGKEKDEVLDKKFEVEAETGTETVILEKPGWYEWEITCLDCGEKNPKGQARLRFFLNREFEGIETLPPLIGGKPVESNAYQGTLQSEMEVRVRWKEYPKADSYVLRVFESAQSAKPTLEQATEETEYSFGKNKNFPNGFQYSVSARLKYGFVAVSPRKVFAFSFLPPVLVTPRNGSAVSRAAVAANDNSVLMTWQKTNFTRGYWVEVSTDPAFKNVIVKRRLRENFFVFSLPEPGKYWWRVQSYSKTLTSSYSAPFELNIVP